MFKLDPQSADGECVIFYRSKTIFFLRVCNMQTVRKRTWESVCCVFLLSLVLLWPVNGQAREGGDSSKIVILPFEIGASGQFDYVRDGLRAMLAGRLVTSTPAVELDYSLFESELKRLGTAPSKEQVGTLLRKLQVDYLVSGTLYSLHKSLRLELAFYPASKERDIEKFIADAKEPQAIFTALDGVAEEVAEKVYGVKKILSGQPEGRDSDGLSGFETAHPERIFKKGIYSSSLLGIRAGTLVTSKNIRQSPRLPIDLVTFEVADLDGDGQVELILCSRNQIRLHQFIGEEFKQIGQFDLPGDVKIHAVNLADLDGNNSKSLVLSASRKYQPASAVVEYNGNGAFAYRLKNIPFYLRPVKMGQGKAAVLVGQRGTTDIAEEKEVVEPGLFYLDLKGSTLESGSKLNVPEKVNLFDFAYVDLDDDKVSELIVIDDKEKLRVYSHDNKLLWVSSEEFGGSINYFGPPLITDSAGVERLLVYIPTRIIVTDSNRDNKPEILIGRNRPSKVSEYRFLPNSRSYESGFLSALTWNGTSMDELWRTSMMKGYITDYRFRLDSDAAASEPVGARLWVGKINESGLLDIFSSEKSGSRLQEYQLEFPKKQAATSGK